MPQGVSKEMTEILLGVNIDHVATLRQARRTRYPDPVQAAIEAEEAGADAITVHLREDRRHVQERDLDLLKEVLLTRMNLELAVAEDVLRVAERVRPEECCLVPERRQELTTEGGLDVVGHLSEVRAACERLAAADIRVSLFIDPEPRQIEAAVAVGAPVVELHTGAFADAVGRVSRRQQLARVAEAARIALAHGLQVNAGHGLNYQNVRYIASLPEVRELNIGHAIIARALFTGLRQAVSEMRGLMREARG
jgi:pyridoxine 5-phosphate synthase